LCDTEYVIAFELYSDYKRTLIRRRLGSIYVKIPLADDIYLNNSKDRSLNKMQTSTAFIHELGYDGHA